MEGECVVTDPGNRTYSFREQGAPPFTTTAFPLQDRVWAKLPVGGRQGSGSFSVAGTEDSVDPIPSQQLVIEVTHGVGEDDEPPDAVRLGGTPGPFVGAHYLFPVALLNVPNGTLELRDHDDDTDIESIEVKPGWWVVQVCDNEPGLQLYWIPPADRPMATDEGGCPICGEPFEYTVYGMIFSGALPMYDRPWIKLEGCSFVESYEPKNCRRCSTWLEVVETDDERLEIEVRSWCVSERKGTDLPTK